MSERTLKNDSEIADMLTEHNVYLRDQVCGIDDRLRLLYRDTDALNSGLQNLQCKINALKQQKYVQEIIIDDGSDLCSRRSVGAKLTPTTLGAKGLQDKAGDCAVEGLEMISTMFKPLSVELPRGMIGHTRLVPNDIYEPIDVHLIRDLPPIVGTERFAAWNMHEVIEPAAELSEIEVGGHIELKRMSKVSIDKPIEIEIDTSPILQIPSNYTNEVLETPSPVATPRMISSLNKQSSVPSKINSHQIKTIEQTPTQKIEPTIPKVDESPQAIESIQPSPKLPTPIETAATTHTSVVEKIQAKPSTTNKSEDSDDSFDGLFKQTNTILPSTVTIETAPNLETSPKSTSFETPVTSTKKVELPVENKTERRKPTKTIVKRSIFDTSSSSEEEHTPILQPKQRAKPTPKANPRTSVVVQNVESEEEMPKTVLNSVGGDFSNRLNAALLRRPQQPNYTAKADSSTKTVPVASSSSSDTNESIDLGPQESVTALRGKLGASITRAHTHGKVSDDDTSNRSKSSGDEKPKSRPEPSKSTTQLSAGKNDLIQTLKSRPRPPNRRDPTANKSPTNTQSLQSEKTSSTKASEAKPTSTSTANKKTPKKSLFDTDSDEPF
ncbi:hypothetical protein M3Y94_00282600 [Aphelenchoides besseyi]|nr:hypothetical protein M3Y94_00282600 [Aphelenchoides besseyi]KAI6235978.1 hypothetical protein M3Y95_00108800 [Aphelenchoides besseyi]